MLIYSLAAPTAALIGWSFLDETYVLHQWAGMFVTLFGVGIVILEKNQKASRLDIRDISSKGVLFGFGAMFCQACGYILSKTGMRTESGYLDAFSSTQIRVIAAFLCFIIFFTITGKWGKVIKAVKDKRAVLFTAFGSAVGPFLGYRSPFWSFIILQPGWPPHFSLWSPIFIIPFSIFLHKEHVSIRAVAGAVTAVFGIYLLMM